MKILDHGSVELVEHWGSDERIIEAARMSTNKGFQGWGPKKVCGRCTGHPEAKGDYPFCPECAADWTTTPGDEKLLAYLWNNKHYTPFEMAGAIFEVKAPIFVFREWHRHRTQSYNEMSGRYVPLPDENYMPTLERLMTVSQGNKQAQGLAGIVLEEPVAARFKELLRDMYRQQQTLYQMALDLGVPKELARIHLPVARYSKMRASANLRNWLHFLSLRAEPNAMWEIQEYARAVESILRDKFPRTLTLARPQG